MSLEKLITEVSATTVGGQPLLINNLFQSRAIRGNDQTHEWQANLRTRTMNETGSYFEFGRGATAFEALQDALLKAKTTEGLPPKKNDVPKFLPKAHVSVKAPSSIEDFL